MLLGEHTIDEVSDDLSSKDKGEIQNYKVLFQNKIF